jgi:hypothetical protein
MASSCLGVLLGAWLAPSLAPVPARAQTGAAPVVRIEGSSTVFPIMEEAAKAFQKRQGDRPVSIALKETGSSAGMRSFCRGEIPISNSSRPISSKELKAFDAAGKNFTTAGVAVVGVRNAAGAKGSDVGVKLFVDEGDAIRTEIGIQKDLFGLLGGRETYVVDASGTVASVFNSQFSPEEHVKTALAAELGKALLAEGDLRMLGRGAEYEAHPYSDQRWRGFYEQLRAGKPKPNWVNPGDFEAGGDAFPSQPRQE